MYDRDNTFEICIICRTRNVTYNHGTSHGETNLIHIIVEPYIHNNGELYIYIGGIYIFVIYIVY